MRSWRLGCPLNPAIPPIIFLKHETTQLPAHPLALAADKKAPAFLLSNQNVMCPPFIFIIKNVIVTKYVGRYVHRYCTKICRQIMTR